MTSERLEFWKAKTNECLSRAEPYFVILYRFLDELLKSDLTSEERELLNDFMNERTEEIAIKNNLGHLIEALS